MDTAPVPLARDLQDGYWSKGLENPPAPGIKAQWCSADELTGEGILTGQIPQFHRRAYVYCTNQQSRFCARTAADHRFSPATGRSRRASVEQALGSGDLATATQAYDKLAAFGPNNSGPFNSPALKQGFAELGQALQAGDLGAAQQAAKTVGNGLLKQDVQIAKQDYQNGGSQGAQQAIANLEGDFWAVTGKGAPVSPSPAAAATTSDNQTASAVNVQA